MSELAKKNVSGTYPDYRKAIREFESFEIEYSPRQIARALMFEIAKIVSKTLKEKNMTRKALAKKLGISPPAITQFLNRNPNISIERLVKIADALDMTAEVRFRPKTHLPAPRGQAGRQTGQKKKVKDETERLEAVILKI